MHSQTPSVQTGWSKATELESNVKEMFCLYLEPCVSSTLNTSKTSSCIVTALVNQLSIKLALKPDLRTFHSLGSNYQIKAKYHKKLSNKTTLFASSKPSHHVLYEYDELFECFAPVQLRKKHTNIYSAWCKILSIVTAGTTTSWGCWDKKHQNTCHPNYNIIANPPWLWAFRRLKSF